MTFMSDKDFPKHIKKSDYLIFPTLMKQSLSVNVQCGKYSLQLFQS